MKNIVENGQIIFGTFFNAIEDVNLIDARISKFIPLPRWFRNSRLKEFQAFIFGDDTLFCVVAIFNAKLSAYAQIRIFNQKTKQHIIYETTVLPWKLNIPNNILDSTNTFKTKRFEIHISNQLKKNRIQIDFKALGNKENPPISGSVEGQFLNSEPLVASIPFGKNVGMYAHKCIVPMKGDLNIKGMNHSFNENDAFFICDDHKGYYPYILKWDWITAVFKYGNDLIGINLTKNQSLNNELFNENVLWINGKLIKLPAVEFSIVGDSWQIEDKQDLIYLRFVPKYPKNVKINYGPFGSSNYEGPMGYLSGIIKLDSNKEIVIKDVFAFGEKQYIRC
jgi:hypothetical protein